jgi:hypothetical protein
MPQSKSKLDGLLKAARYGMGLSLELGGVLAAIGGAAYLYGMFRQSGLADVSSTLIALGAFSGPWSWNSANGGSGPK